MPSKKCLFKFPVSAVYELFHRTFLKYFQAIFDVGSRWFQKHRCQGLSGMSIVGLVSLGVLVETTFPCSLLLGIFGHVGFIHGWLSSCPSIVHLRMQVFFYVLLLRSKWNGSNTAIFFQTNTRAELFSHFWNIFQESKSFYLQKNYKIRLLSLVKEREKNLLLTYFNQIT